MWNLITACLQIKTWTQLLSDNELKTHTACWLCIFYGCFKACHAFFKIDFTSSRQPLVPPPLYCGAEINVQMLSAGPPRAFSRFYSRAGNLFRNRSWRDSGIRDGPAAKRKPFQFRKWQKKIQIYRFQSICVCSSLVLGVWWFLFSESETVEQLSAARRREDGTSRRLIILDSLTDNFTAQLWMRNTERQKRYSALQVKNLPDEALLLSSEFCDFVSFGGEWRDDDNDYEDGVFALHNYIMQHT